MAFYMAYDHTKKVIKLIKFKFKSSSLKFGLEVEGDFKKGQEVEGKTCG